MKNLILFLLSLCVLTTSCSKKKKDKDLALINEIENNLLPQIIIEGDSVESYKLADRMEHYNIPGVSIAFYNKGEIKWAKGYGYLSAEKNIPVNEKTLFQAASISKPVAALAALHLADKEEIGLDDNVNIYLKEWKVEENAYTKEEKVTLRRILSHSAGLTVHGFGGYSSTDTVPGILKVLDGDEPANSPRVYPDTIPGTIYRYSGGGYTVMQKMLCDITGMNFPELMNEYVLSVIGMDNSTYRQPLPQELAGNAASAHNADGSVVAGNWHTYPEMAAAGLWTTPTDLLKYAIEVQNSLDGKTTDIISSQMTEEMLKAQINSHGLGPAVGGNGDSLLFSHGGANKGFRSIMLAFPRMGQGVAIMTNSDNGGALNQEIMRSFSDIYGWNVYPTEMKSVIQMSKEDLTDYEGNYSMEWQGNKMTINLTTIDNHLKGKQMWDNIEFNIFPEDELSFFNKEDGASFQFAKNESGGIKEIIIQDQYVFVKE